MPPTKKSLIRDFVKRQAITRVSVDEANAIRRELAHVLGRKGHISQDYLLQVLAELGVEAGTEIGGIDQQVRDLLSIENLDHAEASLRALDERWQAARARQDPGTAEQFRRGALLMRRRAEMIARNHRVVPEKRSEKAEIAQWCAIWLQTPDLFWDWLEMRKKVLSETFNRRGS